MGYSYLKNGKGQTKSSHKLIRKYLKEGYLTTNELEEYGPENEGLLIGLGKTRKLAIRMEERLKSVL